MTGVQTCALPICCYYHADSHDEVLAQIAHPLTKKILDITLVLSGFVIGFVMIAGAGSNLQQQFNLPFWMGGLICSLLIILVSFFDFKKIMNVLGIFTPILIVMILGIFIYTFWGKTYDFNEMNAIAQTLPSSLPNIWISVLNYFSLCAITAVSMAFILGSSLVRIKVAKEGGLIGGFLIGLIITLATLVLFAKVNVVKDAQIPMLVLVQQISPVFATIYAFVIFALIFNTAFSLFYSLASRLAKGNQKKMRLYLIGLVMIGYALSFVGFKQLISGFYPILGYLGMVLLVVLLRSWIVSRKDRQQEQKVRQKLVKLAQIKLHPNKYFGKKEQIEYKRLENLSVAKDENIVEYIEQTLIQEGAIPNS